MPLTETYYLTFIVLNLFPRSGQFVEPTSRQIQDALSATAAVLYPFHLSLFVWTYYFHSVTLNLQILLECSDICVKLIWVLILYVVVMTYIWLGRL